MGIPRLPRSNLSVSYPVARYLLVEADCIYVDDAASASNRVKSDMPGKGKEAKLQGEVWAKQAGATLDNAVSCL